MRFLVLLAAMTLSWQTLECDRLLTARLGRNEREKVEVKDKQGD